MTTRRRFIQGSAALTAASLLPVRLCSAQRETLSPSASNDLVTPEAQQAIDRGLKYLASKQDMEQGWFQLPQYGRNVAVCSLAGMAWMGAGSTPNRGPHGQNVSSAVNFLLKNTEEGNFIQSRRASDRSHGPMYGHGFATLFLAEVYGMMPRTTPELRERLTRAVKEIVNSQNEEGGWRYTPQSNEADISVTICQVMALRAAKNAGIHVPNETIDRCISYVKRSQNRDGGFMYQLQSSASAFPRSAAGVVALYSAGIYEGDEISKGLNYLMEHIPRTNHFSSQHHYFYGHYYAVQAMWHAGGGYWAKWYPAIREALIARQQADGSWIDAISKVYATSMACIILQMPNSYLPIFQR